MIDEVWLHSRMRKAQNRLQVMWAGLRGQPVMYRVHVQEDDGELFVTPKYPGARTLLLVDTEMSADEAVVLPDVRFDENGPFLHPLLLP
jgi:hypothetical protein